jgi:hypothetical protein
VSGDGDHDGLAADGGEGSGDGGGIVSSRVGGELR